MKRHLKRYTSLKNYIAFLKKQPEHMQHVYAVTFAGVITACIAIAILYIDYGFWRERYTRSDTLEVEMSPQAKNEAIQSESPSEMVSLFFGEVKTQFIKINTAGREVFGGKEVYKKEEQ